MSHVPIYHMTLIHAYIALDLPLSVMVRHVLVLFLASIMSAARSNSIHVHEAKADKPCRQV
jgi:hypothetical protein